MASLGKRLPSKDDWSWQKYAVQVDLLALRVKEHEGIARVLRGKLLAEIRRGNMRENRETILFVVQALSAIAPSHPLTVATLAKVAEAAREQRVGPLCLSVEREIQSLLVDRWNSGDPETRQLLLDDPRCAARLRRALK